MVVFLKGALIHLMPKAHLSTLVESFAVTAPVINNFRMLGEKSQLTNVGCSIVLLRGFLRFKSK